MCATTSASDDVSEAPSELDLLLDRLSKEVEGGLTTTISHHDVCLLVDLFNAFTDISERYDDRVLIEKAKEALAEGAGIKLSEAFRMMQKQASAKNKKLKQIAEITLLLFEANKPKPGSRRAPRGNKEA